MKRIAVVAALALAGCGEDAGTADPNLWLAEKVCAPRTVVIDASATDCGTRGHYETCLRRELASLADEVCGQSHVVLALCKLRRALVCQPDGTLENVSKVECDSEVADDYACRDAKAKGRTKPWPIGGDADAGAGAGGARDGSADGR